MAKNINVQLKQYNGTDYDNIFPQMHATPWKQGKEYVSDDIVFLNDLFYIANVSHTASAVFADDMVLGFEKWRTIGGNGSGGGTNGYAQVTKISVTATSASPKTEDIIIDRTTTFCKPPIEVLKFTPGAQDIVSTICTFDNTDAGDFADNAYVEFDGTMHLKTQYDIPVSQPAALADGFISESDEIDFTDYKKVEVVG